MDGALHYGGPLQIVDNPKPSEADVAFILNSLSDFLGMQVRRADVLSAWSGIRPLAVNPSTKDGDTASIVRDHGGCMLRCKGRLQIMV